MSTLRRLRNFWMLWLATMVLACCSNAVAQASYKVQDLGVQHPDNLGMAMGLNNHGWALNMEQLLDPFSLSLSAHLVAGTDSISIGELKLPLGTLGGPNSSINWNGINDPGELSACPKHRFQIRMAKTFAFSARTLRVFRFFGKTAS